MGKWVRFPDAYVPDLELAVEAAKIALHEAVPKVASDQDLESYALLLIATGTPFDRAVAYLEDCQTAVSAKGRLLLRAAERMLRSAEDVAIPEDYRPL